MRFAFAAASTLAASLALPTLAHAQEALSEFSYSHRNRNRAESPQNVAFELRIGRYIPNVDSEFSGPGPGPYETMFGNGTRYSVGFEVDYQALRIPYLGTLGGGFGVSYTRSSADSFVSSDPTRSSRSGESTSLTILPMYLVAVLRADVIARQTPVPIVPYAKLGLGFAPWIISNGAGTANTDGVSGKDISYGPQFALGGMLLLDAIDPTAAVELDNNSGVNNSYFFVEWYVSQLNGFGSGNKMNVGTNTWVLGLAWEI